MSLQPSSTKTSVFLLTDSSYNALKQTAQLFLPALGTLYFALSEIWGLPAGEKVTGTIAAINVMAGVLIAYFKSLHTASGAGVDGTLQIENHEDGSTIRLGQVDTNALLTKDQVTFQVNRTESPADTIGEEASSSKQ